MNQFPVTCSNAYMEGFIKTCADLNLDADTSATLLQTRQREELFAESPAYREGFPSGLEKSAMFGAIGKGLGWLGGKVGLLGKAKLPTRLAVGAGALGVPVGLGLGAKKMYDSHQKLTTDLRDAKQNADDISSLNIFTPPDANAAEAASGGKGPFDYLNSINRSAPAANSSVGSGSSSLAKLKESLAGLSSQEADLTHQSKFGDPMSRIHATKALPGLQAQRNSMQAQFNTLTSGLSSDQSRMHTSAARALEAIGRLSPRYQAQFDSAMGKFKPADPNSIREAESIAPMLERLKQVREQAAANANRQLL